jgi:hypothetical protein
MEKKRSKPKIGVCSILNFNPLSSKKQFINKTKLLL